ncbi:lipoprotein insertase outer membrane protein LolB [Shewanella marina]|uniref:lipoprotein insertase outer membrane protein LolB n=1 Tax=Shewanella marina TaxID=487319 RepID=UPI0004722772|nr:lipoprotein insertase outer membrane protein LolB [Shewanella marina]
MSKITKYIIPLMIISSIALSGCVSLPQAPAEKITVAQASQADTWELKGKIAIKTPDDNVSTNLYWLHSPQNNQLKLITMLGTTALSLTDNQQGASLDVDGHTYHNKDAQQLLNQVSGWDIPLTELPMWVTGQATANDHIISRNQQGQIKQLQSDDPLPWHIDYRSWQQQSGATIPRLMIIRRGQLQIKIQVNQWQAYAN